MSSLKYLKGVRTRYCNILEKEVTNASLLLKRDVYSCNPIDLLCDVTACSEKLQAYMTKLESQHEKLCNAASDSDDISVDEILNDDSKICDSVLEFCDKLKRFETDILQIL